MTQKDGSGVNDLLFPAVTSFRSELKLDNVRPFDKEIQQSESLREIISLGISAFQVNMVALLSKQTSAAIEANVEKCFSPFGLSKPPNSDVCAHSDVTRLQFPPDQN